MTGLYAIGGALAVAVFVTIARQGWRESRASPPVSGLWSRHVWVAVDGGAWLPVARYDAMLTGHGGDLGRNAGDLFPWPTFVYAGGSWNDERTRLTFEYQASGSRWRVQFARVATQRPVNGVLVPIADFPLHQPTNQPGGATAARAGRGPLS